MNHQNVIINTGSDSLFSLIGLSEKLASSLIYIKQIKPNNWFGINENDVVVVNYNIKPKHGDLVVDTESLRLYRLESFNGLVKFWEGNVFCNLDESQVGVVIAVISNLVSNPDNRCFRIDSKTNAFSFQ